MWDYIPPQSEAHDLVAKLRKYNGRFFDLSDVEKADIKQLTDRLATIRRFCGHNWQEYTLMNGVYRECRYCATNERVR